MPIKPIAKLLYDLFGAAFLVVGVAILLVRTGVLPGAVSDFIINQAQGNSNVLHQLQEFGSLLVFAGLITLWFIRNYDRSTAFHWALTTFWALFALAHWFDVRGPYGSIAGPMINSIPFILFAIVGLLRRAFERTSESN